MAPTWPGTPSPCQWGRPCALQHLNWEPRFWAVATSRALTACVATAQRHTCCAQLYTRCDTLAARLRRLWACFAVTEQCATHATCPPQALHVPQTACALLKRLLCQIFDACACLSLARGRHHLALVTPGMSHPVATMDPRAGDHSPAATWVAGPPTHPRISRLVNCLCCAPRG
jgi:hypothetical protein